MTPESREIDLLVAEKVMDWKVYRSIADVPDWYDVGLENPPLYADGTACFTVPMFSFAPDAAMGIIEHFQKCGYHWRLSGGGQFGYMLELYRDGFSDDDHKTSAVDLRMPMAVCRAALAAMGHELGR